MSTADKLNALVLTKADIKLALIDKGLNPSDVFSTYADDIRAIETGGVIGFEMLGYTGNEEPLKSNLEYSKSIMDNWDASITNRSGLYKNNLELKYFPLVDFSNVTNASEMFYGYTNNLELVPKLNTSNVTNMKGMFQGCSRLVEVPLFDYSKTTTVEGMFELCRSLKSIGYIDCTNNKRITSCIDASGLEYNPFINTGGVTSMYEVFSNLNCSELDMSNFSTASATDMSNMFAYSKFNKLDISSFDVSKVTNMSRMFYSFGNENCELLFPDNFGSNCNTFGNMFSESSVLYIPEINTSNAQSKQSISNILGNAKAIRCDGISVKYSLFISKTDLFGWSSNLNIRYIVIKDIGCDNTYSDPTFDFTNIPNWGIEDETKPLSIGARLSVIDSLITYSFDRATAEYTSDKISLSANTKALLTEEEIAQITAKGYTLL